MVKLSLYHDGHIVCHTNIPAYLFQYVNIEIFLSLLTVEMHQKAGVCPALALGWIWPKFHQRVFRNKMIVHKNIGAHH